MYSQIQLTVISTVYYFYGTSNVLSNLQVGMNAKAVPQRKCNIHLLLD